MYVYTTLHVCILHVPVVTCKHVHMCTGAHVVCTTTGRVHVVHMYICATYMYVCAHHVLVLHVVCMYVWMYVYTHTYYTCTYIHEGRDEAMGSGGQIFGGVI